MTKEKIREKIIGPVLDYFLGIAISKKLTVWVVGTVGWFQGRLTGAQWLILSGIYLFGLLYLNHLEKMASSKRSQITNSLDL